MKEDRKFTVFNEAVENEIHNAGSLKVAYHKVSDEIENKVGFKPYRSLQAYKNARSRHRSKRI